MINVYVKNPSTEDVFELPYLSISFTEELNIGKDAKFSFDYKAVNEVALAYGTTASFMFTSGIREIYVEKNGVKVYLGVISDYTLGKDAQGNMKLDIASVGYMALFSKRRTGAKRVFSNTEAGDIAWTLINESQTSDNPYSDFGITRGTTITSVNRDRTFRFANVKDEIVQMSNLNLKNGFDFDIDNTKKFNTYYPEKGSVRADIVLDEGNIVSWGYRKPLILSLANKVYVLGEGFNDDILYVTRNSDNAFKTTFKLLEEVLSERNIITSETLNDKGDKYLLDNQSPKIQLTINHVDGDPDITSYDVGDRIKVKIAEIDLDLVSMRVLKKSVSIDQQEATTVSIALQQ